jgi:hypothetical protein
VQKTPTNAAVELPSWACSASVVALQALPKTVESLSR